MNSFRQGPRSFFQDTSVLFRKELRIELRSRELTTTTTLFATLVIILCSLSFYIDADSARRMAPGVLWIAIAFSGILAMSRAWGRERDHQVLRGVLATPISGGSIYLAKAMSIALFLLCIETFIVPLVALLFDVDLLLCNGAALWLLALGTIGYAAVGTLFAALSVETKARDLVLSIAIFPLVVPVLLAGVVATREVLAGATWSEIEGWIRILLAYDLMGITAGLLLFGRLVRPE